MEDIRLTQGRKGKLMEVTYEQIRKANETIETVDIKGKNYAQVSQRIKAFRMVYPTGTIKTQIISIENGVCIIKATVGYTDASKSIENVFVVLGEGTAYEKENSSFINKTSYIENCETSAVGRALGMCGFGIDSDVVSFEETLNATINQETITAEQKKALLKKLKDENIPESYICDLYGVTEIKELTVIKFINLNSNWDRMKEKYNARKDS